MCVCQRPRLIVTCGCLRGMTRRKILKVTFPWAFLFGWLAFRLQMALWNPNWIHRTQGSHRCILKWLFPPTNVSRWQNKKTRNWKNLHSVSNSSPFFPLSFDKQKEQLWAFETNSIQRRKTEGPVFKSIYVKYHMAKGSKKATLKFSLWSKAMCPSSSRQLSLGTAGRSHTIKTTGSVPDDWSKMAKWSLQAAQETRPAFRGHPVAQRKGYLFMWP